VLLRDVREYERKRNPNLSKGGKNRWKLQEQLITETEWDGMILEDSVINSSFSVATDYSVTPDETITIETNTAPLRDTAGSTTSALPITAFDVAVSARDELRRIEERMIVLAVRREELEEVVRAVEVIERFATLSREGSEE